jgi:hypothetical protein
MENPSDDPREFHNMRNEFDDDLPAQGGFMSAFFLHIIVVNR